MSVLTMHCSVIHIMTQEQYNQSTDQYHSQVTHIFRYSSYTLNKFIFNNCCQLQIHTEQQDLIINIKIQ